MFYIYTNNIYFNKKMVNRYNINNIIHIFKMNNTNIIYFYKMKYTRKYIRVVKIF